MKSLVQSQKICLCLFLFLPLLAKGAELGVPELMSYYLKHTKKLEEDHTGRIEEENKRYLGRVKKNLETYQGKGDLGAALIAKREFDFLEKTLSKANQIPGRPSLEEFKSVPRLKADRLRHNKEIEKAAEIHREQSRESAEKMVTLLEKRVKGLTQKGNLKEAKGVQNFIQEIREKFPVAEKPPEEKDEGNLAGFLEGTEWEYYDPKKYSQTPAKLEFEKDGFFLFANRVEGVWAVTDKEKRVVTLNSNTWPDAIKVVVSEDFKKYEGIYLLDQTRRHGKLKRKSKKK